MGVCSASNCSRVQAPLRSLESVPGNARDDIRKMSAHSSLRFGPDSHCDAMGNDYDPTDTRPFARPFGGIPVEYDFVPTVLFAIGFAVAFGLNIFTSFRKGHVTLAKTASLSVACERMLATSFRLAQSLRLNARESWGITEYLQATLSAGFVTLMQEQSYLLLCAAISATRDGLTWEVWIEVVKKNPGMKEARQAERDHYRKWVTRMEMFAGFTQSFQIAIAFQAEASSINRDAPWITYCRFFSNLTALFVAVGLLSTIRRVKEMEGINIAALQRMKLCLVLILFIPVTRCLLSFETSNTLATSPSDASNVLSKVAFYLFQLLPELAVCLITATTDYKTLCDTGKWGDYPRSRVEKGLPAKPAWIAGVGSFFASWKWPRLLANFILRMQGRRMERASQARRLQEYGYKPGFSSYEDGEKLLPKGSSVGWKPSTHLREPEEIHQPSNDDAEKQSIKTAWSFTSSNHSGSAGLQASSQSTISSKSTLITDVNLWTPRLLTAFSFDADGR